MFKNSSPQTEDGTSLIGEGLNIEGDLVCQGSIEVAGIMNGSVKAANLKILETGSVIGAIKADKFEVFGAYIFWIGAIKIIGPSRSGVFLHLMPVFSSLMAIFLLGERFANFHIFGALFILTGIIVSTKFK